MIKVIFHRSDGFTNVIATARDNTKANKIIREHRYAFYKFNKKRDFQIWYTLEKS